MSRKLIFIVSAFVVLNFTTANMVSAEFNLGKAKDFLKSKKPSQGEATQAVSNAKAGSPDPETRPLKSLKVAKHFDLGGDVKKSCWADYLNELERVVPPPVYVITTVKQTYKDGLKTEQVATLAAARKGYDGSAAKSMSMEIGDPVYLRNGNLESIIRRGNSVEDYETPLIEERLAPELMQSLHNFDKVAIVEFEGDETKGRKGVWKASVNVLAEPVTKETNVRLMN